MNTSSRFIVALHIMAFMASKLLTFGKEVACRVSSQDLAMSVNTNPVFIRRLLSRLGRAGLVTAERGRNGGVWLAKHPDEINLKTIYEAVEGGPLFPMHSSDPSPYCPVGSNVQMAVQSVFTEAEDAMKESLASRSLSDVANEIVESSGVREMVEQGMSFEEIKAVMMKRAGLLD